MNLTSFVVIFLLCTPLLTVSSQVCEHLDIIPHPLWCSAFFVCRFGFWRVLVCPGGLMYNPENRRCDLPENVDCVNDPELTTPEWTSPDWSTVSWTTPSVPTFSTPSVPTFSTPSVPTFSTPSVPTFSTPSVPTFSTPETERPTTPAWTTPEWTTPTRPSIPTRNVRKDFYATTNCNDSTFPSTMPHADCQYFYKCIDGNPIKMKCEDGLVWNSSQEYCDYPENVICVTQ